jgi:hypothetical protein
MPTPNRPESVGPPIFDVARCPQHAALIERIEDAERRIEDGEEQARVERKDREDEDRRLHHRVGGIATTVASMKPWVQWLAAFLATGGAALAARWLAHG